MKKKKAKVKKIKLTKAQQIELADIKRREKIQKIEFRWPEDKTVWKRYTLRCQKCGARIPLEIKYTEEAQNKAKIIYKSFNDDTYNDPRIILSKPMDMLSAEIPTKQFISGIKNTFGFNVLDTITAELNDYKRLLDAYWFSHAKSFVQRIYKKTNNPNAAIKGVLCDSCYNIEKLKE